MIPQKKTKLSCGRKDKFTVAQMIKALEKNGGLVTHAAKVLECNYQTVMAYCKRYPEIQAAREHINENRIDKTENALFKKIDDGDTACIIFHLKCKGKHRGYVERQELTGADGGAVNFNMKVSFVKSKTEK